MSVAAILLVGASAVTTPAVAFFTSNLTALEGLPQSFTNGE